MSKSKSENDYHFRDHFDSIEAFAGERDLSWKNGDVRHKNGRSVDPAKLFTEYLKKVPGDLTPPTYDQFQDLLIEVTQGAAEVSNSYRLPEVTEPNELITDALEAAGIAYDPASRQFVSTSGKVQPYSVLESHTLDYYYRYRLERGKDFQWPVEYVKNALKLMGVLRHERTFLDVQELVRHDPALAEDGHRCLRWVMGDVLQAKDPDLATEVMKHWLWQVKRYLYNLRVTEPLMINLRGGQGAGKTQFVRMLLDTNGVLRGLFTPATLDQVMDERHSPRWTDNLVCFFDELVSGTSISEGKEMGRLVAGLKNLLTQDKINHRELGTHNMVDGVRKFSAIAASNIPLTDVIRDDTGMRRFFEIEILRKNPMSSSEHSEVFGERDQALDEIPETAMDPLLIWRSIDENKPQGYIHGKIKARVKEIQDTYKKGDIIDWALNYASGSAILRPVHQSEEEAMAHFRELEKMPNIRDLKDYLEKYELGQFTLITSVSLEKSFAEWLKENAPGQEKWMSKRENFIHAMAGKGFPPLRIKSKTVYLVWSEFDNGEEDLDDESPI